MDGLLDAFLPHHHSLSLRLLFPHPEGQLPALLIERRFARIATVGAALIFITYLLSRYPLPALDFVTPAMSQYRTQLRDFGVSVSLWLMFSLVVGYALTVSFVKELYGQLFLKKRSRRSATRPSLRFSKPRSVLTSFSTPSTRSIAS